MHFEEDEGISANMNELDLDEANKREKEKLQKLIDQDEAEELKTNEVGLVFILLISEARTNLSARYRQIGAR